MQVTFQMRVKSRGSYRKTSSHPNRREDMADQQEGLNERERRRQERERAVREASQPKRVRVVPRDDNIRKYIKHMPSGIAFPAEGSVEWPLDQFTQSRIAEGDVTIEESAPVQVSRRGGDV